MRCTTTADITSQAQNRKRELVTNPRVVSRKKTRAQRINECVMGRIPTMALILAGEREIGAMPPPATKPMTERSTPARRACSLFLIFKPINSPIGTNARMDRTIIPNRMKMFPTG